MVLTITFGRPGSTSSTSTANPATRAHSTTNPATSASPATGLASQHKAQQEALVNDALTIEGKD